MPRPPVGRLRVTRAEFWRVTAGMPSYPAKQRLLAAVTLLSLAVAGAACAGWGPSAPDAPDPSLDVCRSDDDCLLVIRIDVCCPCPEVSTRARLQATEGVEAYTPGRDYGPLLPADCAGVACAPCPPNPVAVTCSVGQCQAADAGQGRLPVCSTGGQ